MVSLIAPLLLVVAVLLLKGGGQVEGTIHIKGRLWIFNVLALSRVGIVVKSIRENRVYYRVGVAA